MPRQTEQRTTLTLLVLDDTGCNPPLQLLTKGGYTQPKTLDNLGDRSLWSRPDNVACAAPIRRANTAPSRSGEMIPPENGWFFAGPTRSLEKALKFPDRPADVGTYAFGWSRCGVSWTCAPQKV